MSLTLTKNLIPVNRPPTVSLEFVDATARDAETYTSFDISRIAALADGTFWVLKSVGPDVWEEIFIAPGVGPTGPTGQGFTNLGTWSSLTAYVPYDVVENSGSSYTCIANNTNQAPPNVTYWTLLSSKGDTGATGATGATGSAAAITPGVIDNALVRADGTGNNAIQGSVVIIDDNSAIYNYKTNQITFSGTTAAIDMSSVPSGSVVRFTSASNVAATLASSVTAGWCCCCYQIGAGQVTFSVTGGTLNNRSSHTKTAGQKAAITLYCDSNAGSAPAIYLAGDTA